MRQAVAAGGQRRRWARPLTCSGTCMWSGTRSWAPSRGCPMCGHSRFPSTQLRAVSCRPHRCRRTWRLPSQRPAPRPPASEARSSFLAPSTSSTTCTSLWTSRRRQGSWWVPRRHTHARHAWHTRHTGCMHRSLTQRRSTRAVPLLSRSTCVAVAPCPSPPATATTGPSSAVGVCAEEQRHISGAGVGTPAGGAGRATVPHGGAATQGTHARTQ